MINYLKGLTNFQSFYIAVNAAYKQMFGTYQFIHFPYFVREQESFFDAQRNLTDYCLEKLPDLKGKNIIEVGCGNGLQSIYIVKQHQPAQMTSVDINPDNIAIARQLKNEERLENLEFVIDDAQELKSIPSESVDILINIESALHYPDKKQFLRQIHRVLKPGGTFVVADVLSVTPRNYTYWDKRMYHLNWAESQYLEGFEEAGLRLTQNEDITDKIVQGFENHEAYFKETALDNSFKKFWLQQWGILIFKFNAYNLKTKNRYRVFHGVKPLKAAE